MPPSVTATAIDLFCGAGGLTKGLGLAGIPVVAGIDIDKAAKFAYEFNNRSQYIDQDIRSISGHNLLDLY
ncbi:MAG TPA: DNA cytosine methyltransferase, partial [Gammaproteobacteria bacterium]|nr:DNA cytosine methyltransferase [Gammaproteobacteria bacterium]